MSAPAVSASADAASASPALNRHTVSALSELDELSPIYKSGSLSLLVKVLAAVLNTPADPKFRRLNTAKLKPKLRTEAALKLLESIGFLPSETAPGAEEFMVMADEPMGEQIAVLRAVRDQLQELLTKAEAAEAAAASAAAAASSSASASASSSSAAAAPAASSVPSVSIVRQLFPQEGDTVEDDTHVLFWKPPAWGSQWTMTDFVIDNVRYSCTEQWMMSSKARLFGDHQMYARIMMSASPREHKKLGSLVANFVQKVWEDECLGIVVEGNMAKFSQHESYGKRLLATGNKIIVEASPLDQIWGVGMAASDPAIRNKSKWKGKNLLGIALMQVRDKLRAQQQGGVSAPAESGSALQKALKARAK